MDEPHTVLLLLVLLTHGWESHASFTRDGWREPVHSAILFEFWRSHGSPDVSELHTESVCIPVFSSSLEPGAEDSTGQPELCGLWSPDDGACFVNCWPSSGDRVKREETPLMFFRSLEANSTCSARISIFHPPPGALHLWPELQSLLLTHSGSHPHLHHASATGSPHTTFNPSTFSIFIYFFLLIIYLQNTLSSGRGSFSVRKGSLFTSTVEIFPVQVKGSDENVLMKGSEMLLLWVRLCLYLELKISFCTSLTSTGTDNVTTAITIIHFNSFDCNKLITGQIKS